MKKIFLALLTVLSIFGLASCGGDNGGKPNKNKKTVIQYMGWDSGSDSATTLKREMINKFNETSESIYIEIVEYSGDYDTYLNTLASANGLPDVFLVNSVPNAVVNKLALDITNYANADSEWANVEGSLKDSVTYYERVYAIPSAQHYLGFFANYDLLQTWGQDPAKFEAGKFSTDDFFTAIKEVNNVTPTDGTGVIGVNATGDMINWLPAALDTTNTIKHYVWDGEKLQLDSETMRNALTKIQEIGKIDNKYTFASLEGKVQQGEEEVDVRKIIFGSENEQTVFESGKMAFLQGASYYSISDKADFSYKFVAYPDGKVVSASDYMCVSRSCKNPEAAYEVAKFLTYGADGINARYEIVEANNEIKLAGLPINTDTTLTSKWFDYVTLRGVKDVYEKVVAGEIDVLVEGNKSIPGFIDARFKMMTGVKIDGLRGGAELNMSDFIWDTCSGAISVSQYVSIMTADKTAEVNSKISSAYAKIKELTDATKAQESNSQA